MPAVKGLHGCKIKDVESKSKSSIDVEKVPEGPLVKVSINGGDEKLAEDLIVLSAKHYISSQLPLPTEIVRVDEETVASYDLHCFYFEMFSQAA